MSHNLSEMLDGVFDSQRKIEENEIPSNEFKAVYSKGLKYGMLIATAASMIVNLLLVFLHKQVDIGVCLCIFLTLRIKYFRMPIKVSGSTDLPLQKFIPLGLWNTGQ